MELKESLTETQLSLFDDTELEDCRIHVAPRRSIMVEMRAHSRAPVLRQTQEKPVNVPVGASGG